MPTTTLNSITATGLNALALIGDLDVSREERVMIDLAVSGAPLTAFEVAIQGHSGGAFHTVLQQSSDYTSPDGTFVLWASADLTTKGTSGNGGLWLDVRGINKLRFRGAGTDSSVTILKGGD